MWCEVGLSHPDGHTVVGPIGMLRRPLLGPRLKRSVVEVRFLMQLPVTPLSRSPLHRRVTDTPLREPRTLRVVALIARTAMGLACRLLALPLRDLRVLLQLGQTVEGVSRKADRLRNPQVALVLGE